jgi:hypothetical protein
LVAAPPDCDGFFAGPIVTRAAAHLVEEVKWVGFTNAEERVDFVHATSARDRLIEMNGQC